MMRFLPLLLTLLLAGPVMAQVDQERVDQFARSFSYKHRIHIDEVNAILARAQYDQTIIDKITRPAEAMPWHRYRKIFLTEERIAAGVAFWNQYEDLLNTVSDQYQVDPEIIVSIIGVETYFGTRKGSYRVLDALYTLSFGYPKRAKFFTSELEAFLLLAQKEKLDIYEVKGSYAGAMGYGQFMPSSYEAYARSFEANGTRDLMNSVEDAVASVANYLKMHRWKLKDPVAQEATVSAAATSLKKQSTKPRQNHAYYEGFGYNAEAIPPGDQLVTLLAFDQEDGKEYWFGYHNFYVITRYNHSPLYALAVYQLSDEIKKRRSLK